MPVCSYCALEGWGVKSCATLKIVKSAKFWGRWLMPGCSLRIGSSSLGSTCIILEKTCLQRNKGPAQGAAFSTLTMSFMWAFFFFSNSLRVYGLYQYLHYQASLPFHCFLLDEQEVTTDTLPIFFQHYEIAHKPESCPNPLTEQQDRSKRLSHTV